MANKLWKYRWNSFLSRHCGSQHKVFWCVRISYFIESRNECVSLLLSIYLLFLAESEIKSAPIDLTNGVSIAFRHISFNYIPLHYFTTVIDGNPMTYWTELSVSRTRASQYHEQVVWGESVLLMTKNNCSFRSVLYRMFFWTMFLILWNVLLCPFVKFL